LPPHHVRRHHASTTGLLTVQLAITAGVTAAFCLSPPLKSYVLASPWTFWVAFLASLGLVIALSCSESLRRSHPTNLIALLVFTGCESVLVGMISAMYDTQVCVCVGGCGWQW
jgi:FtsH-binding integral membrane protein